LNATTIAASSLALPTTGAKVTSAALQAASGTGSTAVGEYCKVVGVINPVDPTAPPINFQVNLPSNWNQKAMQLMGGGYDGTVVTGTGNVPGAAGLPTPLARGYATFGSDSGHSGSALEASFALNDEALENYMGNQLRKTRDVAMQLISKRYGTAPSRTYAAGGSGGGREALYVADRWPELYDGVIAYYPAWSLTAMLTNYTRIAQALAAPGAWPNPAKQALIFNAVTTACDSLDGATDGVVSNVAACHFEPQALRCPDGSDSGDSCLSDAQIAGVSSYASKLTLPFSLANGTSSYPAFSIFNGAASLTGAAGSLAPVTPSTTQMAFAHFIGESFIRYWITRDPNYDALTFDLNFSTAGYFRHRMQYISSRQDISTNLSPFASKGGKVLMLHGQADAIIPVATAEDFYNALVSSMGAASVQSFMRFYEAPGYAHGNGAFNVSWDSVTALENWVERGTAPTAQTIRDSNATSNNRTRPLCDFPAWPKYNGTGDINAASSFTCVTN
jgi:feruloyl esterase